MKQTDPLPIDENVIQKAKLVAECIVTTEKTRLLSIAEKYTQIHIGKAMLDGQLGLILDLFIQRSD